MKIYVGTKLIQAEPMSYHECYVTHHGLDDPGDTPDRDGYLVKNNDGTTEWKEKELFEVTYKDLDKGFSLSHALFFADAGDRVTRPCWKGSYIQKFKSDKFKDRFNAKDFYGLVVREGADPIHWKPTNSDMSANDYKLMK